MTFCTTFHLATVTSFSLPTNLDEEISACRIHHSGSILETRVHWSSLLGTLFSLDNWLDTDRQANMIAKPWVHGKALAWEVNNRIGEIPSFLEP